MVTTLKNTAKPVTEVQFPAITICSSGFHMSNVEKKIEEDFAKWRLENKRIKKSKEAIQRDVEDYMFSTFQIKTEDKETYILKARIVGFKIPQKKLNFPQIFPNFFC